MGVQVTARVAVQRERRAPGAGVGRGPGRGDVGGEVLAGEEPDGDVLAGPVGGVDAAPDGVEAGAEVGGVGGEDAAALVFGLRGGVGVAVGGVEVAGHGGAGGTVVVAVVDGAAGGGVEGHGIGGGAVDAFDDVDFAGLGPIGADEPKGGPDAADAAGHVSDVGEEEAMVVCLVAGDTDALAARVGRGGGVIDAHVGGVTIVTDGADHLVLHGGGVVDILHEPGRGVRFGEGGEGIEEVVVFVVVGEDIAGYAHADEDCGSEKTGEPVGMHVERTRTGFDCGKSRMWWYSWMIIGPSQTCG